MGVTTFILLTIIFLLITCGVGATNAYSSPSDIFYNNDLKKLDLCTPYSAHIGDSVNDSGKITSCASELGLIKYECNASHDDAQICSEPRYVNWLVNDYGSYPVGTWDFPLCGYKPQYTNDCPGATYGNMVRP
jgi:hypothetical protein